MIEEQCYGIDITGSRCKAKWCDGPGPPITRYLVLNLLWIVTAFGRYVGALVQQLLNLSRRTRKCETVFCHMPKCE